MPWLQKELPHRAQSKLADLVVDLIVAVLGPHVDEREYMLVADVS